MAVLTEDLLHTSRIVLWPSKTNDNGISAVLQPKGCQKMPQADLKYLQSFLLCVLHFSNYFCLFPQDESEGRGVESVWLKDEERDIGRRKNEHRWGDEKDNILFFFFTLFCFGFPLSSFSVLLPFEVNPLQNNEKAEGDPCCYLTQWNTGRQQTEY